MKGKGVEVVCGDSKNVKNGTICKINVDGTYDVIYENTGERELEVSVDRINLKKEGIKNSGRTSISSLEPLGELEEIEEAENDAHSKRH